MKLKTLIKRKIIQTINKTGYELVGKKSIIKHNNFDAIIKFLIKEFITSFSYEKNLLLVILSSSAN